MGLGATTRALVHSSSTGSCGWLDDLPLKSSVEIIAGDIRNPEGLRKWLRGVDTVFHLAALPSVPDSMRDPRAYFQTNVEGTLNVLLAARDAGATSVVHSSSSEVYGATQFLPIDEEHPQQARSPYAATKIAADKLAESFHHSYGLPVAIIRPFNTYGPRQSAGAVVPYIVRQALTKPQVRLSSLTPERDFIFVADTVDGYIRAVGCPAAVGQAINIGSGVSVSIGELAATIIRLLGRDIPIVEGEQRVHPYQGDVDRVCADNSRARDVLGWQPQYPLVDGLTCVIDWIQNNLDQD